MMIGCLFKVRYTMIESLFFYALYFSEHSRLDKDENISKEKFLKLNDFEVQDKNTTEDDLWTGLKAIGFNYALELDMVCCLTFSRIFECIFLVF